METKATNEQSDIVKANIKAFIKDLNAIIGHHSEKAKATGLPGNLGAVIISGGLAFTAANWFTLLKGFGYTVSKEEYTGNFMSMVKTAIEHMNTTKAGTPPEDTMFQ